MEPTRQPAGTGLSELQSIAGARLLNAPDTDFRLTAIGLDSQSLVEGAMFAALPGTRVHGATFAHNSAASAILTDHDGAAILEEAGETRPILVVEDVREILGDVAARIYGDPTRDLTVIGVTGTSGKTTVTYMLEAGLSAAGCAVGLIGTTGTRIKGREVPTSLTTPEAPKLQELFAQMRDEGVTHVVMEVSSHALVLGRVRGVRFDVAGFTNLSQDHLDFHPTMEDYFAAKAMLFDPASPLKATTSVVCVNDAWGEKMAALAPDAITVRSFADEPSGDPIAHEFDCTATLIETQPTGAQKIEVHLNQPRFDGTTFTATIPMPGAFNVANAGLALAIAVATGAPKEGFLDGVAASAVPGRMERIDEGQDFIAVVDYAHKPAAVAAVLDTLRKQVSGRIGVVIGAGGDRDRAKRPMMGAEAARRADLVIVTDDNPRTEDPAVIRKAVLQGAKGRGAELREVASRAEAISDVVAWADPGDAVIIVGKGHEVGQIVGTTTHHFDDREELSRAIQARAARARAPKTGMEDA
ncbi:UDP-N-acetylmuramoyl-L-alanyl-D-glutamate--2,6-diaminopimelate ligase [Corynebacterium aquatimens]|uniref:UDP-N-acetylmuramoyl-L-alanyl-D-glutamate--2,6-diaminopimelate ligase n=1 Tax=Corynebacterium aquatimens TaxID=1190508 RepID=A0A931E3S7_9CORY|nr:UDP-N-acetylmuramoyl-L-alanyl-D-glutamate--2,6-diaminopimelate ligase [Corynebacterium aquatimens]MBG6121968.1 UDP-N-acetylmuramoyl-L-alanyl-D-glutamate--2,6-diaminopimelate ligase [Corynebacterium aquatimens]